MCAFCCAVILLKSQLGQVASGFEHFGLVAVLQKRLFHLYVASAFLMFICNSYHFCFSFKNDLSYDGKDAFLINSHQKSKKLD